MKVIKTRKYSDFINDSNKRYLHIQPSSDKEGLYEVVFSVHKQPNLGGQVFIEGVSAGEARDAAQKWVSQFGGEILEWGESSRERYDKWLGQSKNI